MLTLAIALMDIMELTVKLVMLQYPFQFVINIHCLVIHDFFLHTKSVSYFFPSLYSSKWWQFLFFAPRTLKIATRHSKEFQNGVGLTFLYSLARTRHIITFLKRQNEPLVKITIQDNYGSFDVNWNIFMISAETEQNVFPTIKTVLRPTHN